MKTRISVQERLKDLRVEQGLNLEELAQKTGISKSALGSYENDNDEYKEINHGSLLKLASSFSAFSAWCLLKQKSAHSSRNSRNRRITDFSVVFRGDFP